jgi:hypothetical protein
VVFVVWALLFAFGDVNTPTNFLVVHFITQTLGIIIASLFLSVFIKVSKVN